MKQYQCINEPFLRSRSYSFISVRLACGLDSLHPQLTRDTLSCSVLALCLLFGPKKSRGIQSNYQNQMPMKLDFTKVLQPD